MISIHALLAESDVLAEVQIDKLTVISIHALLAESDRPTAQQAVLPPKFLSTLSLRRATIMRKCSELQLIISIHALLAESDALY